MAEQSVFTKTVNGKSVERVAHTPADAVKLRFEGWVEKARPAKTAAAATEADGKGRTAAK
jgi:hypothetical protein